MQSCLDRTYVAVCSNQNNIGALSQVHLFHERWDRDKLKNIQIGKFVLN